MTSAERLAPLVAEAAAQAAACQVRLEFVESQAKPYGSDPLPETLQQDLDKARADFNHRRGMWSRLKAKLDADSDSTN